MCQTTILNIFFSTNMTMSTSECFWRRILVKRIGGDYLHAHESMTYAPTSFAKLTVLNLLPYCYRSTLLKNTVYPVTENSHWIQWSPHRCLCRPDNSRYTSSSRLHPLLQTFHLRKSLYHQIWWEDEPINMLGHISWKNWSARQVRLGSVYRLRQNYYSFSP